LIGGATASNLTGRSRGFASSSARRGGSETARGTQEDLTESFFDHTQQFREIDIAFFIPDPPRRTKFALRVGKSFQWGKFKKPPDIEGIVARPTDAHLVDDCLLLGFYPEKDPKSVTGRKENMLRYVGLRIETAE
jgi:hypothetical protein